MKRFYAAQMMCPDFPGLFINPFYFARKGLYDSIRGLAPSITGRVLDVGCGTQPYRRLFLTADYTGMELDTQENRACKRADVFYGGHAFPFDGESFDSLVCSQVLEHVFTPGEFVRELHRVLRPGGFLLLTVPFVWDEHEQPYDYARYTSFGLLALMREAGFEVVEHVKTMGDVRVLCQLVNAYLYKVTVSKSPYLNLLSTLLLMAPINLFGAAARFVAPSNLDLYLDNVILAKKVGPE
ncbi:MAG: class I SAM-dependent methyltransferase [Nitrospira sp.]|nr:class I SAM-dependent methyltransferase [Nitrospira sp.]